MQLRNLLYDYGIFRSVRFSVPVISVGNISAGGTGKTPLTIFLAKYFKSKNKNVAIISRGYGRKDKTIQYVFPDSDPLLCGDEPVLIANSVPGSVIAVGAKRAEVIEKILSERSIDLIILDDGFQHRFVQRDLDIVIYNFSEKWKNHFVIPTGNLREFRLNLKRADSIVLNNYYESKKLIIKKPLAYIKKNTTVLVDINNKEYTTKNVGKYCIAFCGIANPDQFRESLIHTGFEIVDFFLFKDHHIYKTKDLQKVVSSVEKNKAEMIICTEKDLVKIRKLHIAENFSHKLFALKLEYSLNNAEKLFKMLDSFLDRSE